MIRVRACRALLLGLVASLLWGCTDRGPVKSRVKPPARIQGAAIPTAAEASPDASPGGIHPSTMTPAEQYGLARGILEKGDACAAATMLRTLTLAEVQDHLLKDLGAAELGCGRKEEALQCFLALSKMKDSRLGSFGENKAAELYASSDRCSAAIPLLEHLERTKEADPSDLLRLGRCLDSEKRGAEAAARFRDLAVRFPHRAEGDQALSVIGTGRLSVEERLERIGELLGHRRFDRAREEAEAFLETRHPAAIRYRGRWLFAEAVYKGRKDYGRAAEIYDALAKEQGPRRLEAQVLAARAMARAGRNADAIRRYRALARRSAGSPEGCEALLLAVRLELSDGDPKGAGEDAGRALRGACGSDEDRRSATWLAGFALYLAGKPDAAKKMIEKVEPSAGSRLERSQARYWSAVSLLASGRKEPGALELKQLAVKEPAGYYGALARIRLRILGEPLDPPAAPPSMEPGKEAKGDLCLGPWKVSERVRILSQAGLLEDAADEIWRARDEVEKDGREGRRMLAEALFDLKDYPDARKVAFPEIDAPEWPPTDKNLWAWLLVYPLAWESWIREAEEKHHVSRFLLYAVMARESGFEPGAVSRTGARGLYQIMPFLEERVAQELDLDYEPETGLSTHDNLLAGAFHLSELLARYNGDLVLTLAAYNAGAAAVDDWQKRFGKISADRFVELIPYQETRNYVRRVLTELAAYSLLYGKTDEERTIHINLL